MCLQLLGRIFDQNMTWPVMNRGFFNLAYKATKCGIALKKKKLTTFNKAEKGKSKIIAHYCFQFSKYKVHKEFVPPDRKTIKFYYFSKELTKGYSCPARDCPLLAASVTITPRHIVLVVNECLAWKSIPELSDSPDLNHCADIILLWWTSWPVSVCWNDVAVSVGLPEISILNHIKSFCSLDNNKWFYMISVINL